MTLRFFAFLLLLTLGLTVLGRAQSASPAADQYCALIVTGNHYSAMSMRLEYGQDNEESAVVPSLKEEAAKVRYLSLVGALNHLSKLGWELVASNAMPMSGGATTANPSGEYYSEQQYILRRRR